MKLTLTLVVVLISLLAGRAAFNANRGDRDHPWLGMAESFGAGVFLAAGLVHMLGDADSTFVAQGVDYPFAPMICGAVLMLLLWVEHVGHSFADRSIGGSHILPITAVVMLGLHSLLMGAAFGITTSLSVAIAVFIAVIAHKGAASFALGLELSRSGMSYSRQWQFYLFFVAMFPLGVALGQYVGHMTGSHPLVEATFSAIAAGTFLFFGTLHGLSRSPMIAKCCNAKEFMGAVVGFGLMALVAIWT
jgi:solute carrier family 39 (zinc transporter), member 1/2/3